MAVLNEANDIRWKLAWLDAHPGKTRRDYNAGLNDHDSDVWKWRRARGQDTVNRERRAWLKDHPRKTADDYERANSCAATVAGVKAMSAWRAKR